jgi:hypothetical protein
VAGTTIRLTAAAAGAACIATLMAACGDDSSDPENERAAPPSSEFPAAQGRTTEQILADSEPGDLVVSPSGSVYPKGDDRFGFAVFTVDHQQITDADVAIYAAPGADAPAKGPYPARLESLATDPGFTAQTTSQDPDAATVVYVTDLKLDLPGEWRLIALVSRDDETTAVRLPSISVDPTDPIPAPGEKAPPTHTPTVEDVGDVSQIDTRVPPDTMHDTDLADVLGKQPVVLLFATPALCQSRVCGPVVDVAEQVKAEHPDDVAFIHMEIYNDNDPNRGLRPQVSAYHLQTEPWLFVIDRNGRIDTRIEGAFSVDELEQAVDRVAG